MIFNFNHFLFIFFTFLAGKFESPTSKGGCCVSDNLFHVRCVCNSITIVSECESLCTEDGKCKGYVMETSGPKCHLATTSSSCQYGCKGPSYNTVASLTKQLDPRAKCSEENFDGCFIKRRRGKISIHFSQNVCIVIYFV